MSTITTPRPHVFTEPYVTSLDRHDNSPAYTVGIDDNMPGMVSIYVADYGLDRHVHAFVSSAAAREIARRLLNSAADADAALEA